MCIKVLQKSKPVFLLLLSLFLSGCSIKSAAQEKFGIDAEYYAALKLLDQGLENEARTKFNKVIKKGTYYCARKSAEALTTFGNLQEQNQAVLELYKQYPDSDALLLAVKQFTKAKDLHRVIELSRNCDYTSEYNETIKLRLEAMKKQGSSSYNQSLLTWFTSRKLSDFHYKYWRDTLSSEYPDFNSLEPYEFTPEQFIINYRIRLYKRDYTYGVRAASQILEYFEDGTIAPNSQLVSDMGKAFLYGSPDFVKNADKFKKLAQKYAGTDCEYFFWFYAARYYGQAINYFTQTKKCYENAMACAPSPEQKDDALWYLLDSSLRISVDSILDSISNYSHQWSDPIYFEDFFEALASSLLAGGRWDAFYKIYSQIDGFASDDTVAAYAYIYARLLQAGVAEPTSGVTKENAITTAFERATKSGAAAYYKIMAAYQLDYDASQIEKLLCKRNSNHKDFTQVYEKPQKKIKNKDLPKEKAAEILLEGYAYFGYPQYIYDNFIELYPLGLSTDTYIFIADFLRKCGNAENDYYTQSLRIACRAASYGSRDFTKEELKLLYPKDYQDYVETYCKKYDVNDSVMFALIRSESFFDSDVSSSMGAVGLTQLMEFTGSDIAQRLRRKEYSLTEPETNIEFGVWYLNNLYHRFDENYLQAFSAYNAGATKFRRWMQGSIIDLGNKSSLDTDLFLETIPATETREYGRKLISASTMYEWLYNTEEPSKLAFKNMLDKLIK